MNSKVGMFPVLVLGIMMLLIPASSLANAQEYEDKQYKKEDKKSYNEPYKKKDERKSYYNNDKENSEEPLIIIKNEPIQKKEKKMMKEPPMLLVTKDVLYCDVFANNNDVDCGFNPILGPDSDRYVQECTATEEPEVQVCNNINEDFFKMIVTDDIEFPGSEEGTKLNFNGERYTVTEEEFVSNEFTSSLCQEAGFDDGFVIPQNGAPSVCILSEGDCSGIIQDGELKECTIKNYIIGFSGF